ncbi:MAG: sensor histidine kinase [Desulfobulbaceae bacterium]|nr:sensor histidine kinase [Desulfobulbaceae bacterium]
MHFRLCDYALDLVQNAVEAGAGLVVLKLVEDRTSFILGIEDNGCGMDEATRAKALDPFYTDGVKHATRKVGLGLPFVKQALDATDGSFLLDSKKGRGTILHCCFDLAHVDTPPIGDVATLVLQCMLLPGVFELQVLRSRTTEQGSSQYELSRRILQETLGDFCRGESLSMLRRFIRSQEDDLK